MNSLTTLIDDKIIELQDVMELEEENIADALLTRHYHADGLYCRELLIPAGVRLVGKMHKKEHLCMITKGIVQVISSEAILEVEAPYIYTSAPGAKRAILAITDTIWTTVHHTNLTDLTKIEEELVVSS